MSEEQTEILTEPCPACGTVMDVSGLGLFSEVTCPACGASVIMRTQLDHYRLLKKLGKGGMGEVFRALDQNLQREIALKVLHRDFSGSEEEQTKLAEEARRTASVNHPNVVKVYNYGSSGGQFYLAMELVPHGTLDDLMELQGKISEIQVLTVAIQVAGGLQAALDCDLIHRDIKPGNILFSDAATAKLVDFGLALVMDEVAAAKGEIWGTPYYVAPEKLDGGDEDFRSDIYSLGGTIFHALAGRPPYEAETASMVALKQLKSQPISLQTYAPDVSEETAYVVNRMMSKDPSDRYQSYAELIEHLEFSKQKILERMHSRSGPRKKPAVVQVETSEQRKVIGLLMVALIAGLVLLVGLGYFNRDRIAVALGLVDSAATADANTLNSARELLLAGDPAAAIPLFESIVKNPRTPQPQKNWAVMQLGAAQLLAGQEKDAALTFNTLPQSGLYSDEASQRNLAGFFVEVGRMLSAAKVRNFPAFATNNYDAMGLFLSGLHNWANGDPVKGAAQLQKFVDAEPPEAPYEWIGDFRPLATNLIADAPAFAPLQRAALTATPESLETARRFLRNPPTFQTQGVLAVQIQNLEKRLDTLEAAPQQ